VFIVYKHVAVIKPKSLCLCFIAGGDRITVHGEDAMNSVLY